MPRIFRDSLTLEDQQDIWSVLSAAADATRKMRETAPESAAIYRHALEVLVDDFASTGTDPAYVRRVQSILTGVRDLPRRRPPGKS